jgi:hypothetical protein
MSELPHRGDYDYGEDYHYGYGIDVFGDRGQILFAKTVAPAASLGYSRALSGRRVSKGVREASRHAR